MGYDKSYLSNLEQKIEKIRNRLTKFINSTDFDSLTTAEALGISEELDKLLILYYNDKRLEK